MTRSLLRNFRFPIILPSYQALDVDASVNIFLIAKQMVKKNNDVAGAGCVRNADGEIVMEDKMLIEIWKRFCEKQMINE